MNKYSVAIDLGTTTIELCIICNNEKNVVASDSFKNRQALYGSDVINRIFAIERNYNNYDKLRQVVIEDIKNSVLKLCSNNKISIEDITKIVFSGNTTMNSILLKKDVSSLGKHPFTNCLSENVVLTEDIIFNTFSCVKEIVFIKGASAFIGGDILSGLLYLSENNMLLNNSLLLDLGTNGEMILKHDDKFYATSASCGPAFEGAIRKQNAYGSNVIDAISLGINARKISKEGILQEPFLDKGIEIMGIKLTASIIHDIILAKAAIISGIEILLNEAGVSRVDLMHIYIAGNFGLYLNLQSAYNIKMLPKEFEGKIKIIGNSSLEGAKILCESCDALKYINDFSSEENFIVIQPSLKKHYEDILLKNMTF